MQHFTASPPQGGFAVANLEQRPGIYGIPKAAALKARFTSNLCLLASDLPTSALCLLRRSLGEGGSRINLKFNKLRYNTAQPVSLLQ